MKNTRDVRVGIVGAGANTTSRHIPGLQAIDGVTIVSVCNRSRASSEKVAKQFAIERVYDDWKELVEAEDTNAIVIGTWPYLHCPITLSALASGKHVLTEARMAMNAAEARLMLAESRRNPHLIAQVVPSPLTLSVDKTICRLIAEAYLGEVLAVEIRDTGSFIDLEAPLHWRHDATLSGYNIMSMGIWYEAMLRWVGPAKRVTALGTTFVKTRRTAAGTQQAVSVPDHVSILGELVCGAQLHLQVSAVMGHGERSVTLYGSEATLRFHDEQLLSAARGADSFTPVDIPDEERGGWRVEEEFIAAIRGEEIVTHTSFEDGVKYMEFTEAVHRSMREGRTVTI